MPCVLASLALNSVLTQDDLRVGLVCYR